MTLLRNSSLEITFVFNLESLSSRSSYIGFSIRAQSCSHPKHQFWYQECQDTGNAMITVVIFISISGAIKEIECFILKLCLTQHYLFLMMSPSELDWRWIISTGSQGQQFSLIVLYCWMIILPHIPCLKSKSVILLPWKLESIEERNYRVMWVPTKTCEVMKLKTKEGFLSRDYAPVNRALRAWIEPWIMWKNGWKRWNTNMLGFGVSQYVEIFILASQFRCSMRKNHGWCRKMVGKDETQTCRASDWSYRVSQYVEIFISAIQFRCYMRTIEAKACLCSFYLCRTSLTAKVDFFASYVAFRMLVWLLRILKRN